MMRDTPRQMDFDKHAFISYAHLDNTPLDPEEDGWITRFHDSLTTLLGTRLGRAVSIWRDNKLQGNDMFGAEIVAQFPTTALLVSVLSPRYVASEWCTKEAREFCARAEAAGTLAVEHKARVFKVIKTPVDNEDALPDVMKAQLGYPFFVFEDGQTPVELDAAFGEDYVARYNLKLAKLAYEMAQTLRRLETSGTSASNAAASVAATALASARPTVYLAECSYDRRDEREALEAELKLQGYPVLPDRPLPRDESDYVRIVSEMLRQSRLAIHLVGGSYGAVPDGPSEKSVAVLQNELAIACTREQGLPRLIWLPEATISSSPAQERFIAALRADPGTQFGADLIAGTFEVLKSAVQSALRKIEAPPAPTARTCGDGAGAEGRLIHLICDQRDRAATIPLRRYLQSKGHDVKIPLFEGAADIVHRSNRDLLVECDSAMLFYGAGDEAWRRTVETDLRKTAALRATTLPRHHIYLAPPITRDKEELVQLETPNLIRAFDGLSESAMAPFLSSLRSE